MNRRKQQWIGCLLFLLVVVGIPGFLIWRELREERLSAQLMAAVQHIQFLTENMEETDDDTYRLRELRQQISQEEAKVVRLLQEGADPNVRDFVSVNHGLWEEVELLLKRIFKHPSSANLPRSALAFAVQAKDTVVTVALLQAGANDVNAELETHKGDRYNLVNYSASIGNLEITKELCAKGADLHKLDSLGEPILLSALGGGGSERDLDPTDNDTGTLRRPERERRTEIFHLLLAKGARYEANSKEGHSLLLAATAHDFLEVTRDLLAAGAPPNARPKWLEYPPEYSPLDNAVDNDDISLIKLLLQYGAATRSADAEAPMLFVRNPKAARLLLAYGADLHATLKRGKFEGENALDFACTRGDTQVVAFLIEHGFNINPPREYGGPIRLAIGYGGIDTVRLMLKHGAKVGPNSPGAYALTGAINRSKDDIAILLLRYGAAVNTKDYPPLTAAAEQDDVEMARELLKRGAKANADKGKALLAACESCDEDLVELLLEHGADSTLRSPGSITAIQAAKQNADPPSDADGIIALLKEYGAKR